MVTQRQIQALRTGLKLLRGLLLMALPATAIAIWLSIPQPPDLAAPTVEAPGTEAPEQIARAACDEGWAPPSAQIGQTGKKIAPELYLAIAISGAAQHVLGISDAKAVCAINRDPDAQIFRHSHFGIVEDYRKVVPLLIDRLRVLTS